MHEKITKIFELRKKGWSPSRIARNINLPLDVVKWILDENIQEVKVESGNVRVLVNYKEVADMLEQDGFRVSADFPGSLEIKVDLKNLKTIMHNFQVLKIKECKVIL